MAFIFALVYALTVVQLFTHFPSDEALVRAAVLAVAYVCAYVVVRSGMRLVHRTRRNGRENLPKV